MPRTITMLTFTCARCGVEFTRRKQDADPKRRAKPMYCSRKCASQARDPATRSGNPIGAWASPTFVSQQITLTCDRCGTTMRRNQNEAAQYRKHYCSEACRLAAKPGGRFKTIAERPCEHCGTMFYSKPSRVLRGWGKFCSHACYARAQTTGTPRACLWCGKVNMVVPSRDNIYCDRECRFEHMRADPTQHVGFKGGRLPYYGANWTKQRRAARERDKHTCQRCHLRRQRPALHVHHIRPLRDFNGDYLAANVLSNLVTLCSSCHKRVETQGWQLAMPELNSH